MSVGWQLSLRGHPLKLSLRILILCWSLVFLLLGKNVSAHITKYFNSILILDQYHSCLHLIELLHTCRTDIQCGLYLSQLQMATETKTKRCWRNQKNRETWVHSCHSFVSRNGCWLRIVLWFYGFTPRKCCLCFSPTAKSSRMSGVPSCCIKLYVLHVNL